MGFSKPLTSAFASASQPNWTRFLHPALTTILAQETTQKVWNRQIQAAMLPRIRILLPPSNQQDLLHQAFQISSLPLLIKHGDETSPTSIPTAEPAPTNPQAQVADWKATAKEGLRSSIEPSE